METCDIIGVDPYPLPKLSLRHVFHSTNSASKASLGLKPVWTILDAYNGKEPNVEELRCMAYLALSAGANGIGIYAWDDRKVKDGPGYYMPNAPYSAMIPVVTTVMQELEELESILVQPNISDVVSINPEQPAIHASIKQLGNSTYLFLANDSRKGAHGESWESATVTLASGATVLATPHAKSAFTQSLQFTNGVCQVSLPPLGTALLKIATGQQPYTGTAIDFPGVIQAEDY